MAKSRWLREAERGFVFLFFFLILAFAFSFFWWMLYMANGLSEKLPAALMWYFLCSLLVSFFYFGIRISNRPNESSADTIEKMRKRTEETIRKSNETARRMGFK